MVLQDVFLSDIRAAHIRQQHPCKGKPLDPIFTEDGA